MTRRIAVLITCNVCRFESEDAQLHHFTWAGVDYEFDACTECLPEATSNWTIEQLIEASLSSVDAALTCAECGFIAKSLPGLGRHKVSHRA